MKQRINKLVTRGESYCAMWDAEKLDMVAIDQEEDSINEEMEKLHRLAGEKLSAGHSLYFGVADGNALYVVLKVRKNDVVVAHIPLGDAYQFRGTYYNAKNELVLPRRVADQQFQAHSVFA